MADMKVETDIITSITAILIVLLMIMNVKTFNYSYCFYQ